MSAPADKSKQPTGDAKAFEKPKSPAEPAHVQDQAPGEVGGRKGPEPTRYGDWEVNGIVSDF